MKEYPECLPKEVWLAVILTVIFAVTFVAVYCATRITPEREEELKAEGAAAFDRRVEAAGGWDKWIAGEVNGKVKVEGEGEQRIATSTVHLNPSPSAVLEVRHE